MSSNSEIMEVLPRMLGELLQVYDERVSEEGPFNDLRVKKQVFYDDPVATMPGILEIAVMSMDADLNPDNKKLRFVAVRVKKSPRGGAVSSTCFHGTKVELKAELERELRAPDLLANRIEELASGLPEETNPNMWR